VNENKILAAILVVAVNCKRQRTTSTQAGREDWRIILDDYHRFLIALSEPGPEQKA